VGPQLSELELSDSDSSVDSILGVCLDGFDGNAWMSDAEGAQDDIQVGADAGVNDPGDIPWRTTGWRAGAEDVVSDNVGKMVAPPSGTAVNCDLQGGALSDNSAGYMQGGDAEGVANVNGINLPLSAAQKKEKKRLHKKRKNCKCPSETDRTGRVGVSHYSRDNTTQQLARLLKLSYFQ